MQGDLLNKRPIGITNIQVGQFKSSIRWIQKKVKKVYYAEHSKTDLERELEMVKFFMAGFCLFILGTAPAERCTGPELANEIIQSNHTDSGHPCDCHMKEID